MEVLIRFRLFLFTQNLVALRADRNDSWRRHFGFELIQNRRAPQRAIVKH